VTVRDHSSTQYDLTEVKSILKRTQNNNPTRNEQMFMAAPTISLVNIGHIFRSDPTSKQTENRRPVSIHFRANASLIACVSTSIPGDHLPRLARVFTHLPKQHAKFGIHEHSCTDPTTCTMLRKPMAERMLGDLFNLDVGKGEGGRMDGCDCGACRWLVVQTWEYRMLLIREITGRSICRARLEGWSHSSRPNARWLSGRTCRTWVRLSTLVFPSFHTSKLFSSHPPRLKSADTPIRATPAVSCRTHNIVWIREDVAGVRCIVNQVALGKEVRGAVVAAKLSGSEARPLLAGEMEAFAPGNFCVPAPHFSVGCISPIEDAHRRLPRLRRSIVA
jgi:hypothetical protein